jgi:hypothetical protein
MGYPAGEERASMIEEKDAGFKDGGVTVCPVWGAVWGGADLVRKVVSG